MRYRITAADRYPETLARVVMCGDTSGNRDVRSFGSAERKGERRRLSRSEKVVGDRICPQISGANQVTRK